MANKRAQRLLAQLSGQDQSQEKEKVNELSLSQEELIQKIYARQSTNGKGEFIALPWEFYKQILNIYDSFEPDAATPVRVEPQIKYKYNQPVGVDRIWIHIIIGRTINGEEIPRELLYKGSSDLPKIETWEELTSSYTFGWYRGRNIKKNDGTIIPKGRWYFACRPKNADDDDLIEKGEDLLNEVLKQDQEEANK